MAVSNTVTNKSPTIPIVPVGLYAKRDKIHPRSVSGLFARFRLLAVIALLGLYFGMPWITWNGRQAVLFDLPARHFHVFGITFWPQDFYYLAALLLVAAFALFFFTALAGRLWCGYSCPQTVWTEIYIWIEKWVEGDRNQRIKLDAAPLSLKKVGQKIVKHSAWLAVAFLTGYTFVGYFTPIHLLTGQIITWQCCAWDNFWVAFFTFATYLNAGWMREQVCFYMCPYARFQSVMFDPETLIISYDAKRGETRGSRRRDADYKANGLGDCIDCMQCVHVCPVGIDIRDGLQYQCIGCAACVDACDSVMEKMQYPKGLVRYTTENALAGDPTRILRPRIYIYATLLVIVTTAMTTALLKRVPMALDIIRDRNALYRALPPDEIENVYNLRLMNKDQADHRYTITVEGLPGIYLENSDKAIHVQEGDLLTFAAQVRVKENNITARSSPIIFTLSDDLGHTIREKAKFIGPEKP